LGSAFLSFNYKNMHENFDFHQDFSKKKIDSFYQEVFLFPKKIKGFFVKYNKLFNKVLSFQHQIAHKNNFFVSKELKEFIVNHVSFVYRNPFFPDIITFVFGNSLLGAQNVFDKKSFFLLHDSQFFDLLLSFFVNCFLGNKKFACSSLVKSSMLEFILQAEKMPVDTFFKKTPIFLRSLLLKRFLGLNKFSFDKFRYFFFKFNLMLDSL
jgi:hypothetical protein